MRPGLLQNEWQTRRQEEPSVPHNHVRTAYLIWKPRNERHIRDDDDKEHADIEPETTTRWINVVNKSLTTDRLLTDEKRFRKRALKEDLRKRTWRGCLENEDNLPNDWFRKRGVLVGISRGHVPRDVPGKAALPPR
jgi:hypothetical protein